jgi:hypothetical protein
MEIKCVKLYAESMGIWMQLTEDVDLQKIGQKTHVSKDKVHNFKEVMSTLPPTEVVTTMAKNRKLYSKINQLREEQ